MNGYHGVTVVSASMTGKPYNSVFGLPLPGFIHLTCPHYWREGQDGETEAEFTAAHGGRTGGGRSPARAPTPSPPSSPNR